MISKPNNFLIVIISPKNKTPIKKTTSGAEIIKGLAFVIPNLVMIAIQKS